MIIDHVQRHGTKSWSLLAGQIANRTGKQVLSSHLARCCSAQCLRTRPAAARRRVQLRCLRAGPVGQAPAAPLGGGGGGRGAARAPPPPPPGGGGGAGGGGRRSAKNRSQDNIFRNRLPARIVRRDQGLHMRACTLAPIHLPQNLHQARLQTPALDPSPSAYTAALKPYTLNPAP
jgi:hypothetical protein